MNVKSPFGRVASFEHVQGRDLQLDGHELLNFFFQGSGRGEGEEAVLGQLANAVLDVADDDGRALAVDFPYLGPDGGDAGVAGGFANG